MAELTAVIENQEDMYSTTHSNPSSKFLHIASVGWAVIESVLHRLVQSVPFSCSWYMQLLHRKPGGDASSSAAATR